MQNTPTTVLIAIFELINQLYQQIQTMILKLETLLSDIENTRSLINQKNADQNKSQKVNTLNISDIFKAPQLEEKIIKCSVCKTKNENLIELAQHINKKHKDNSQNITDILNSSQALSSNPKDVNDIQEETTKNINCFICGKMFKHKYGLLIHQHKYHDLRMKSLRIPIQTAYSIQRMSQIQRDKQQQ